MRGAANAPMWLSTASSVMLLPSAPRFAHPHCLIDSGSCAYLLRAGSPRRGIASQGPQRGKIWHTSTEENHLHFETTAALRQHHISNVAVLLSDSVVDFFLSMLCAARVNSIISRISSGKPVRQRKGRSRTCSQGSFIHPSIPRRN